MLPFCFFIIFSRILLYILKICLPIHIKIPKTNFNIVARGGVDVNAIEKSNEIGFAGLAFYSAIWRKKDPLAAFNKIIERFQELKIPIE